METSIFTYPLNVPNSPADKVGGGVGVIGKVFCSNIATQKFVKFIFFVT